MAAQFGVAADIDARDHCVVVVKATFRSQRDGTLTLAAPEQQRPFVYADEFHGEPGTSSVALESDFACRKAKTDVIVLADAVAPAGREVESLEVALEVDDFSKRLRVTSDRHWVMMGDDVIASNPAPFTRIPLIYERSLGGIVHDSNPDAPEVDHLNPVGVSALCPSKAQRSAGSPLPNIEYASGATEQPAGFGCIARSWQPRLGRAGTYSDVWRQHRFPYLPEDFDEAHYQCAPDDQQFSHFRGGECIKCTHMSENAEVRYTVPERHIEIRYVFADAVVDQRAILDTVIVEPGDELITLHWRSSTALGKKPNRLREIQVCPPPVVQPPEPDSYKAGKPVFKRLSDAVAFQRAKEQER